MFAVGLTGGIGSGKSTVADLFAARGCGIVDTDLIAHRITAPHGIAMPQIAAEFGASFVAPDGSLDRARMRTLDLQRRRRAQAPRSHHASVDPRRDRACKQREAKART